MDASSYVASYSLIIHPAFRKCRASSCGPGNFKNEERPPFFTVSSLELHHVDQGNRVNDAPWRTPVSRRELVRIYATWILKARPTPLLAREATYDFSSSSSRLVISRPCFLVKENRDSFESFDCWDTMEEWNWDGWTVVGWNWMIRIDKMWSCFEAYSCYLVRILLLSNYKRN